MYYVITTPDDIPMQMPEVFDSEDSRAALKACSKLTEGEFILWIVENGRMSAIATAENGDVEIRLTAAARFRTRG